MMCGPLGSEVRFTFKWLYEDLVGTYVETLIRHLFSLLVMIYGG